MRCWLLSDAETVRIDSLRHPDNDLQQCITDFWCCILGNLTGDLLQLFSNAVFATISSENNSGTLPAPSWKWTSQEPLQLLVFHLRQSICHLVAIIQIGSNGSLFNRNSVRDICYPFMKISVNWVSTMFHLVNWLILASHGYLHS